VEALVLIERWRARERELSLPVTPAIALTAYARWDDRHRVLGAGYQAHLAKPVTGGDLASAVVSAVRHE
jgi:CheY-like chemotaxis protein